MKIFDVKPKFKVGDWIVGANSVYKVVSLNDELSCYIVNTVNNEEIKIPYYFDCGPNHMCSYHLWTIQDAKVGDVLAIDPWSDYPSSFVAIYKKQNGEDFDSYCFVGFDGKFYKSENGHSTEEIHPASKEQRELLFAKMHEACYEWDEENKELKKIETLSNSWTEEDNKILIKIITALMDAKNVECADFNIMYNWLNSLKKRIIK